MSIIYCDKHALKWDSDFKSECPACEDEYWPECQVCDGKGYVKHLAEPGFDEPCPNCESKGYLQTNAVPQAPVAATMDSAVSGESPRADGTLGVGHSASLSGTAPDYRAADNIRATEAE